MPPRLSDLRLRKGAKDKKEGFVESKGAVAVKDGGIGGMDGSKEKRIRRRMDGGKEGWMDKEKDG